MIEHEESAKVCILCGCYLPPGDCNICEDCGNYHDDPQMEYDQQNYCLECDNFLSDDEVGRCQDCINKHNEIMEELMDDEDDDMDEFFLGGDEE